MVTLYSSSRKLNWAWDVVALLSTAELEEEGYVVTGCVGDVIGQRCE